LGFAGRDDDFHYGEAFKRRRVLLSYDDGYSDSGVFPMNATSGVIVVKRNSDLQAIATPLQKFIHWIWRGLLLQVSFIDARCDEGAPV
jgi:hypothetical protein